MDALLPLMFQVFVATFSATVFITVLGLVGDRD